MSQAKQAYTEGRLERNSTFLKDVSFSSPPHPPPPPPPPGALNLFIAVVDHPGKTRQMSHPPYTSR
eukprot:3744655-Pyramimonas_sp.AAC.1